MTNANEEEWRSIPGWPYDVSSLGRVRSYHEGRGSRGPMHVIAWTIQDGHPRVRLRSEHGEDWSPLVRNLVAMVFLGAPSAVPRDGDTRNVALANLEATDSRGETTSMVKRSPKLTPEQVVRAYLEPDSAGVARDLGVNESMVRQIKNGRKYRTITAKLGPPGRSGISLEKRAEICADTGSLQELGRKHGVDWRTVRKIKREGIAK